MGGEREWRLRLVCNYMKRTREWQQHVRRQRLSHETGRESVRLLFIFDQHFLLWAPTADNEQLSIPPPTNWPAARAPKRAAAMKDTG